MKTSLLNRTKIASVLVISFMVGVPSVVSAIDFFSSDNPVYVGAGFGKSNFDDVKIAEYTGGEPIELGGSDSAKLVFIGKPYNKDMDIEAFYIDLGTSEAPVNNNKIDAKRSAFGAKAVYKFSPTSGFQPYATLGYVKGKSKVDYNNTAYDSKNADVEDGSGMIFGGGVMHTYSSTIKLRAEYTRLGKDTVFWGGVSTTF